MHFCIILLKIYGNEQIKKGKINQDFEIYM